MCGRQNIARAADRIHSDEETQKGYWAEATSSSPPAAWMYGKTERQMVISRQTHRRIETRPTPGTDECANLANSGGDAVVFAFETVSTRRREKLLIIKEGSLTADASGTCLCREQTNVVSGPEFAQCEEHTLLPVNHLLGVLK